MALSLWWILISAASGQSTFGVGEIQVLPRVNDSDTGSVTFREKRANGTNTAAFSAPDSITSTYRLRLPASSAAGALTNDGSGNLTWVPASALSFWTEDGTGNFIPDTAATQDLGSLSSPVYRVWSKYLKAQDGAGTVTFDAEGDTGNVIFAGTLSTPAGDVIGSARQGYFSQIEVNAFSAAISLRQLNPFVNSAGTLRFWHTDGVTETNYGTIDYDKNFGFIIKTTQTAGGSPLDRWVFQHIGSFLPMTTRSYNIGSTGALVSEIHSVKYWTPSDGKFYAVDGSGFERARLDSTGLTLYTSGGSTLFQAESTSGSVSAALYNATGTGYRIGGTTVIDSLKTIRSGHVYPDADATRDLGDLSLRWNNIYGANMYATSQVFVAPSGIVRASMSGSGLIVQNSGGTTVATINSTAGNITSVGTISSSGGYIAGGLSGITVTCGAGLTVRQPQYVGGILVSGTCGF